MFTDATLARRRSPENAKLLSARSRAEPSNDPNQERTMKLIRTITLLLAVCLPATWTLAHAEEGAAGAGGEMKDAKPKKKSKKAKKADGDMETDKK
jgi:hypothetical protein